MFQFRPNTYYAPDLERLHNGRALLSRAEAGHDGLLEIQARTLFRDFGLTLSDVVRIEYSYLDKEILPRQVLVAVASQEQP